MKKRLLFIPVALLLFVFLCSKGYGNTPPAPGPPYHGTYTVGGAGAPDFATLTEAFSLISSANMDENVILELQSGYSSALETFPLTPQSAASTTSLTVRPAVSGLSIVSGNAGPTFQLSGVNYFILDGRAGGSGSTRDLTISNTNTAANSCAIKFVNDANNNIVRYCILRGATSTASGSVVWFSTSTGTDGNDNNLLEYCDICDGASTPTNCIYSSGTSGKDNSGNTISHCNIYNFFLATGECNGILIAANSLNWVISDNSFYQTASRTFTAAASPTYFLNAIAATGTTSGNFTITGNYIGGDSPLFAGGKMIMTGGAGFKGMRIGLKTGTTASIQGNVIQNINLTTQSNSSAMGGISLVTGSFSCGNVTPNTIGSLTTPGSITISSSGTGGPVFSAVNAGTGTPVDINISNNVMGGIDLSGGGNAILRGIWIAGASTSYTVTGNIIGSSSAPLSSSCNNKVNGIYSQATNAGQVISNNTIQYLVSTNITTSNQLIGLWCAGTGSGGSFSVYGNTISDLTSTSTSTTTAGSASVIGISITANVTAGQAIYNNIIQNLSNTDPSNTVQVTGIYYNGPPSGTNYLSGNKIHSLSVPSSLVYAYLNGIIINGGNTTGNTLISNNMIALDAGSADPSIYGFLDLGTVTSLYSFYYNTILLTGNSSLINTSYCFNRTGTSTFELKDNILVNRRTAGNQFAINLAATSNFTSNYNDFYSDQPYLGNFGGTTCPDMATWKSLSGQDANSINILPAFVSSTDLHLLTPNNCALDGKGTPVSVTTDIDAQTRNASTPDIGADEFTSVLPAYPVSGGNQNGCQNNPIPSLSATGSGTIKWYGDAGLTSLLYKGSPYSTGLTAAGLYVFYVTDSVNGCESLPIVITLNISPAVIAGLVSPNSSWTPITNTSYTYNPGPLTVNTRFRAVLSSTYCPEVASAYSSITVNPLPTVTFTGTLTPQCVSNALYTLTGGNPSGGSYSGPGVLGNNFNASSAGTGIHTLTYTYLDGNSCSASATNTITVYPLPAVTFNNS
ncbi:MAG: hypothetical protein NTU44_09910, partial [Bacteroidetes bacterium]|nr:hypothetical protein [Bacteroidota bacterium]